MAETASAKREEEKKKSRFAFNIMPVLPILAKQFGKGSFQVLPQNQACKEN